MKSKKLLNPFPVSSYHGPDYFCDRQEETDQILNNIKGGISTVLLSIRRIGKTGLIQHVLYHLPEDFKSVYVDILDTENINHLLNKLSTALLQSESENSGTGKKIWNFLKSIRPVITFDAFSGMPQASFDIKHKEAEYNIEAILSFLNQQDYKTVIAIDEFQQILQYPETKTDAWLRSQIQQLKNIVFIFSGSQQHLMSELFSSPSRPFYRSALMLRLEKLDFKVYRDFIIKQFKKYNKRMPAEVAEEILNWGQIYTYYIQLICNRTFTGSSDRVTSEIWKDQVFQILKEQEIIFLGYRNLLTNNQWSLLKSIAKEDKLYKPTNKFFISKNGLSSSSIVLRSLESLMKYDLVFKDFDKEGKEYYSVYDVFFQKWCSDK